MQFSYWEQTTWLQNINYLIIGSGIVGINAALTLRHHHPQANITILERGMLPSGASTKNAGFACFGSSTELIDDFHHHTSEQVFELLTLRWQGLQKLRNLLGDKTIDYKPTGAFELFQDEAEFQMAIDQQTFLNQMVLEALGKQQTFSIDYDATKKLGFAGFLKTSIFNQHEGQLHTGKMMNGFIQLAKSQNIQILNGCEVTDIDTTGKPSVLLKNKQQISADKILIATNGFAKNLLPELQVKPARNQVIITEPIDGLKMTGCFHFDKGYTYFRNVGNRVLLGGARNIASEEETTDDFGLTSVIQDHLETMLQENILPGITFKIENRWSGILGVGDHKQPIIKRISDRVVVAVRLGGMGVAIGSILGEKGAKLLIE